MPPGDDAEASLGAVALLSHRGGFVMEPDAPCSRCGTQARDLGRGRKSA
jgi:hypothetical protein